MFCVAYSTIFFAGKLITDLTDPEIFQFSEGLGNITIALATW